MGLWDVSLTIEAGGAPTSARKLLEKISPYKGIKELSASGKAPMDSSISTFDSVTESARERLRSSPYLPVRWLACEFDRGVLRLRGRLSSFYQKQLAQEAVIGLSGVEEVINEVVVAPLS